MVGVFAIALYVFLAVLGVLWFILPFFIYGMSQNIKEFVPLLRSIKREAFDMNKTLVEISRKLTEAKQ